MINKIKAIFKKAEGSPFFTFSEKPLDFFEKDKLFKIIFLGICIIMAVVSLVHPLTVLFRMLRGSYFSFGMRFGIGYFLAFVIIWIALAAACWFGFHIWWSRQKKAATLFGSSEFVVLPFFSEIIRTFGEWLAIMYAVVGFVGGLFSLIFVRGNSGRVLSTVLGIGGGGDEIIDMLEEIPVVGGLSGFFDGLIYSVLDFAVILGPLAAVAIILITRFISENLKVFAAIANSTKKSTVLAAIANNAQKAAANRNGAAAPAPRPAENYAQQENQN